MVRSSLRSHWHRRFPVGSLFTAHSVTDFDQWGTLQDCPKRHEAGCGVCGQCIQRIAPAHRHGAAFVHWSAVGNGCRRGHVVGHLVAGREGGDRAAYGVADGPLAMLAFSVPPAVKPLSVNRAVVLPLNKVTPVTNAPAMSERTKSVVCTVVGSTAALKFSSRVSFIDGYVVPFPRKVKQRRLLITGDNGKEKQGADLKASPSIGARPRALEASNGFNRSFPDGYHLGPRLRLRRLSSTSDLLERGRKEGAFVVQ